MNVTPLQDSFNRGELSPLTFARSDAEFYLDGAKTMRNFVPVPRGATERRSGFRYLGEVALPSTTVNVFPQTVTLTITTPSVQVPVDVVPSTETLTITTQSVIVA